MVSWLLPQNDEHHSLRPITTFVVKVASRCNIACTYCYMYEHADQTWRDQPPLMSQSTIKLLGERIREYVKVRKLSQVLIVAHGGEPLLVGPDNLSFFFGTLRDILESSETTVGFGIQTNGMLINPEFISLFQQYGVLAGVSLDGPKEWNDVSRIDKLGRGTYERVMKGVSKLQNAHAEQPVFGGILTVINPDVEPDELLSFIYQNKIKYFDVLLPDFNHDTFPYEKYPEGTFGTWLIKLFDMWMDDPRYQDIEIRTFKTFLKLILGGERGYDSFGAYSGGVLVVETDGTYHLLDVLKTAFNGATKTGKSLLSDPIVDVEKHPAVIALANKKFVAPEKCLKCRLFETCGGGYLPHRYKGISGFMQESIYCPDLIMIIDHITARLEQEPFK